MSEEFKQKLTPKLRIRNSQQPEQQSNRISSGSKITLPKLFEQSQPINSKEVDKEIVQLELNSRVRELEILMIDFKANIERRIQKTIEENPQKFIQSFKQLEQQELQQWKQINDKQSILQDQINQLKNQNQINRDSLTQMILDQQKKQQDQELKLQGIINQTNTRSIRAESPHQPIQIMQGNDLELKLLREQFINEKVHRDTVLEDIKRQWQDMFQRVNKQENEFYQKMKQQREEFHDQQEQTKQSIKGLDNMKMQKINTDQDYMRNLIGSVESRIADEVEKRLRNEFEQRNVLENKLQAFKEEIRNDEKQILIGEHQFMKQMQDSVSSLNQILKNTKEQLEANLAASQTIVSENLKSLSKTTEMIRESTFTKVALIEQGQKELNYRVGETKQMFHEHANLINGSLQKEFQKQQEQLAEEKNQLQKSIEQQMKMINEERLMNTEWKKQFTNKNLVIFAEVSQNFKNVKGEQIKDRSENQEQQNQLRRELTSMNDRLSGLIGNQEQAIQGMQQQFDFRFQQNKRETEEQLHNQLIHLQTEILNSFNLSIQQSKEMAKIMILENSQQINDRITKEMELAEQLNDHKLKNQQINLKDYVDEKEKIIVGNFQNMFDQEKEERSRLEQLMEIHSEQMRQMKEQLEYEIQNLKKDIDNRITLALQQLQNEFNEKLKDQLRLLQQENLNLELKLNQKLDVLSAAIQKQFATLKEYIQNIERSTKSYVEQRLEEHKFELKSMIKEIENDLFKLRVWTLKQVELMNQAMQDMHIQIQSEMYMDKMYMMTNLEMFFAHIDSELQIQLDQRIMWQREIEIKQEEMQKSLQNQIITLRQDVTDLVNQLESQFGGKLQELETNLNQNLQDIQRELSENIEKQSQEFKEQQEQLKAKMDEEIESINTQFKELNQQIDQKLDELNNALEQKIEQLNTQMEQKLDELNTLMEQKLKELNNQLNLLLKQLRTDIQNGFNDFALNITQSQGELKHQIDQTYSYFSAKFYIETNIRQANEALDQERHTGIIGKLNLLVKEMERLEEKKNKLKVDLANFISGAQSNFDTMQKAIVAHGQYLNELDAKMTLEQMFQQTINESMNQQLQVALVTELTKFKEKQNELEEKIELYNNTVHDQMETIQVDQEEINIKTQQELEQTQKQQKDQETNIMATIASIEIIKSMSAAMETNLVTYVKEQVNASLDLLKKNFTLVLQNIEILEKNIQITMNEQLESIITKQNEQEQLAQSDQQEIVALQGTTRKLIEDTNKLAQDTDDNFDKMNTDIQKLQQQVDPNKEKQKSQEINDNLQNYGIAIENLNSEVKSEFARLQQQIDNLGQNAANIQSTGKNTQTDTVSRQELLQVQNKIVYLEDKINNQPAQNKSGQQSPSPLNNKNEIQQISNRMKSLEDDVPKLFEEMDIKLNQLNDEIIQLQSQQPQQQGQQPSTDLTKVKTDIQTIKQDLAKLQKQASTNSKPTSNTDVQEIKQDLKQMEEDFGKEIEKIYEDIDILKAAKSAPTPANNKGNTDNNKEIKALEAKLQQFAQEIESEFENIRKEMSEMGGGNSPDHSEIENLKNEIAKINKQLQTGGAKQPPQAFNQETQLLKEQISKLEEKVEAMDVELEGFGAALEKNDII